jgi:hypothetical protein
MSLNPHVGTVEIGIRTLREITILPLSLAGQIQMSEIIAKAASTYINQEDKSDLAFGSFLTDVIQKNIIKILSLVTDEENCEGLLEEITNNQFVGIADLIYVMNYESSTKNFLSLVGKAKKILTV